MVQALTGNEIQVSLMPEEAYERFWPQIDAELDKVPHVWRPYVTKEYLRDVMLHRELMVWCTVEKGAVMMVIYAQFIETPRGKGLCFILALGNGLDKARDQLEATYERLGQVMGCDFVEIRGRRGWVRGIPGFKEDYVVASRQLRNFRVQ
jgi:hypothetical protein